jgi:signal transduction histidine kinase
MTSFRDVSYRIKVPLALSAVIIVTAAIMSALLGAQIYSDARRDLLANAEGLGRTLARGVAPAMMRDDVWQTYEAIKAPLAGDSTEHAPRRTITIVDAEGMIYASTDPQRFAMLSPATHGLGAAAAAFSPEEGESRIVEDSAANEIRVAVPIAAGDGSQLGSVVLSYSEDVLLPRFFTTVRGVVLSTLIALAVLLPIGWKFGRRLVAPLLSLSDAMARVGSAPAAEVASGLHRGGGEIGRLGERFEAMLNELEAKRELEREMVAADRLAAIGRLTAGIAHEINNPLTGMLTAVDTTRKHGNPDPVVARTLSLIERGLEQIRNTVSALLVEARVENRALTPKDIDDVRTLLEPQAAAREQRLCWQNDVAQPLPLPSTPIRQILMNLVINAIQAAGQGGRVSCHIAANDGLVSLEVRNDGRAIPAAQLDHLFEPFASGPAGGSGLGLWVTYQIVEQLRGTIRVRNGPPETEFTVALPLGVAA